MFKCDCWTSRFRFLFDVFCGEKGKDAGLECLRVKLVKSYLNLKFKKRQKEKLKNCINKLCAIYNMRKVYLLLSFCVSAVINFKTASLSFFLNKIWIQNFINLLHENKSDKNSFNSQNIWENISWKRWVGIYCEFRSARNEEEKEFIVNFQVKINKQKHFTISPL